MKPSKIHNVLDLAYRARQQGRIFNPLFVGDAGLGKSSIIQQWCKKNSMPFIDLRGAYLEAPDMIGFPSIITKDGRQITSHNIPEFWPTKGKGIILIEEPNRATTAVMNTFMQLLTDRRVHQYDVPEGWFFVGAINPENEHYDVNTMDAALKNRFATFEVEYDKRTFVEYMKTRKFEPHVISFVESNAWTYTKPENLAAGAKHISPRTIEQLDTAEKANVEDDDQFLVYESILGKAVGKTFFAWKNNDKPVLFEDIVNDLKGSVKRLKVYSDPNNYKNSQISITIKEILDNKDKVTDDMLVPILLALPVDQSLVLIKDLEYTKKDYKLLTRLCDNNKDLKKVFKEVLNTK